MCVETMNHSLGHREQPLLVTWHPACHFHHKNFPEEEEEQRKTRLSFPSRLLSSAQRQNQMEQTFFFPENAQGQLPRTGSQPSANGKMVKACSSRVRGPSLLLS